MSESFEERTSSEQEILYLQAAPIPEQISQLALQDILVKCVRELGAIRVIDSCIGVPGHIAWNPNVILGRFRTTTGMAWPRFLIFLLNLKLYSMYLDIHRTISSLCRRFCWTPS
jgi:hypothetical protein